MKLTALLAALVVVLMPAIAFADTTTITVPVGDWTASIAPTVEAVVTAVVGLAVTWVLSLVPATLKSFITQQQIAQAEQLLTNAIGYGINSVVGAEKGKTLEINVGNAVAAQATQYAIDHGPGWLVTWLGGEGQIQQKIIARLPMVSGVATPLAAAPNVVTTGLATAAISAAAQ